MAEYNITMNQLNAQGTYDTLNPTTKANNITGITSTSDYGLEANANINDILTLLKNSIQSSDGSLTLPDGTNVVSQIKSALGNPAKVETGSYVGTGTYGINNKNTINFNGKPLVVYIFADGGNGTSASDSISITRDAIYFTRDLINKNYVEIQYQAFGAIQFGQNSVSWYIVDTNRNYWPAGSEPNAQMNYSGTNYYYYAITV